MKRNPNKTTLKLTTVGHSQGRIDVFRGWEISCEFVARNIQ